jgi:hypothetical protein
MRNSRPANRFFLALLLATGGGVTSHFVAHRLTPLPRVSATAKQRPVAAQHEQIQFASKRPLAVASNSAKVWRDMPLSFAENRGQVDTRAAFLVQGRNTTAYFTAQGLTLALTQQFNYHAEKSPSSPSMAPNSTSQTSRRWNLKLDFIGANPAVRPEGRDLTPARVSYFSGPPQNWHIGIQTYSSVVYSNLWPGIDLAYSGTTNRLKYEFIVKPGADPRQIKLAYRGTSAPLAINTQGQLEITTPFGVIRDDKPVSHQGKGKQVKTEFVVHERAADGSQEYGFKVGKYDKRKTLIIDPAILIYSGFIGGSGDDEGHSIAVDSAGNAYVTGITTSSQATFPETAGPDLTYNGRTDAFVAKIKADGSGLVYAGYIGGDGDDQGRSIAVDSGSNAYVAGLATSSEATFPMVGALDTSFNGGTDAFVAKINSTGSAISYSGYIGGSGIDEAFGIAVDGLGNAYVTGRTTSTEATFPEIVGPDLIFNGMIDAFVAKINAAGSALSYAGYIGGSGDDEGFGIAVDGAGNAHVTGRTTSSEATFPVSNAFDLTLNGTSDGFIAKVNPMGNALAFAGYLGGNGLEEGFGAAIAGVRQLYVAGRSTSVDGSFLTRVSPALSFGGGSDAFATKIVDSSVACPTISITPASLPAGTAGTAYNQTLTASGGFGTYTFSLVGGGLPNGLMLSPSGVISGTPTAFGTFPFTARATDSDICAGDRVYSLVINPPCGAGAITVNPPTLPNGFVGTAYNQTVTASGGASPYTFMVSGGMLPGGLSLSAAGVLSGMPAAVGSFTFTVKATDNNGCMGTREYTVIISGNGLVYYPLQFPVRLLETRPGEQGCFAPGVPLGDNAVRTQQATGTCNGLTIPANAKAIVGNATVVNFISTGFHWITLYPSDAAQPNASNLNFSDNQIVPNNFTVGLGPDGGFKIYSHASTHFIVDITGYYAPPGAGGLYYHRLPSPVRLFESRPGESGCDAPGAPLADNGTRTVLAHRTCLGATIPSTAKAIVGNATVVNFISTGFHWITLYPFGQPQPNVSNLNFHENHIVPNWFVVGLSSDGKFNIYSHAATHFIVDVAGYFSEEPVDTNGQGLLYTALSKPVRLLETRPGEMGCTAPGVPLGNDATLTQAAHGTCSGETIPNTAKAVVGNATVVNFISTGFHWITLYPFGVTQPNASNLNFSDNQIVPNAFWVGLSGDGKFNIYSHGSTHFIVDLTGYFSP